MLLDSGAAVFACPPACPPSEPDFLCLEAAQCDPGQGGAFRNKQRSEAAGESSVRHQLQGGNGQWPNRSFFSSLSWLEDAGWTFESTRAGQKLRREQEEIEVSRRHGVSWVRLDDARKPETALRRCPFSADVDVQPAKEVRSKKISVILDDGTRSTRYNTPPSKQLVRPLDGGPSPPPRQKQADDSRGGTRLHVLGDDCRPEQHEGCTATILHAVDIQTLMRMGAVEQEGVIKHVIATVVSFLDDLGYQRVL